MYKVYQVLPGDTLTTVAKKTDSNIDDLANINGISNTTTLVPGTFLVVPATNSMFDSYTIQKGDTLYSIASKYGINADDLILLNGLNKNDFIYPGDILLVPKSGYGVYITKLDDTIDNVVDKTGSNLSQIVSKNPKIFLKKDQLIIYKKR